MGRPPKTPHNSPTKVVSETNNAHSPKANTLERRALCIEQNPNHPLFLFTLNGKTILDFADVSRVSRSPVGQLIGYQRSEVKSHVRDITDYLNEENILFPNAIILALSSDVKFIKSRGPNVSDGWASGGILEFPIPKEGEMKPAWIVDGQQRALALSICNKDSFPVPIIAFVADDISIQRDQFFRINNTKPLPRGLVNELLPEVSTPLPPKLAIRKTPAALCDLLNQSESSPFCGLIRRPSTPENEQLEAVIADNSIISMLKESLNTPGGCLFPYHNIATKETDFSSIFAVLTLYWGTVKRLFPEAWGLSPKRSRLMHGVGLRSMGRLMDKIMSTINPMQEGAERQVEEELNLIVPSCRWTDGTWEGLGLRWDQLQNTPSDVKNLSNHVIRLYLRAKMGDT